MVKTRSWSRKDRLSCLPDEIICHILSFLRTKRSVQTSLLSKRWRFLWAHVPSLRFSLYDTVNSNIVTKIVLQHKHDIHTFHLFDKNLGGSEDEIDSWIENITTANVMDQKNQFVLPRWIFTCNTLVDLSLSHSGDIPMSGIYFPALKKLKLHHVRYESHESLGHLISACPVLEELIIIEVKLDGHCCVSSPTLIRLVIESYSGGVFYFGVKLDTPALRYLWLHCPMPDLLSVGTLDSLFEANIRVYWDEPRQDNFICSRNLLAFVGKLHNAKLLKLSAPNIAAVHDSAFFASDIKFHNITELELSSNLGLIRSFLENADNLQAFMIHTLTMGHVDNESRWMEPKQVPECLISHLQSVDLYFGGSKDEFEMVRYILMHAKVLKVMEVRILSPKKSYWKKRFEAERRRRRLFERNLENATKCSIKIV